MKTQTIKAYSFITDPDIKHIRKDIEQNPEQFLKEKLTANNYAFGVSEITRSGVYKEMGYKYDFRPFLKKYVYKKYGSWSEMYSLNKTNLRKLVAGRVEKILEVI